jgi:hypothetical protein
MTEISEEREGKEQNSTLDIGKSSLLLRKEVCAICERSRIGCPCQMTKRKSAFSQLFERGRTKREGRLGEVSEVIREKGPSSSVPKITFSYASSLNGRHRSNSITVPEPKLIGYNWNLQRVTHTLTMPQAEEIIYYPVIHNKIKYITPTTP